MAGWDSVGTNQGKPAWGVDSLEGLCWEQERELERIRLRNVGMECTLGSHEGLRKGHQTWRGPNLPRGSPTAQPGKPHSQHRNRNSHSNSTPPICKAPRQMWESQAPRRAWLGDLEVTVLPELPHASDRGQGESEGLTAAGEMRKNGAHDS